MDCIKCKYLRKLNVKENPALRLSEICGLNVKIDYNKMKPVDLKKCKEAREYETTGGER